ncbi:MAG: DUF2779 domain-containing protein, partial [Alphaproteobacteria bacterium]|nr:DUF2779 domain-containing protein [Alphaproteobacteria bacterium]
NVPFIYEATFATVNGEYCAIDILQNNYDGTWNIIEVKSTNHPHDYHFIDTSFQRYVLNKCGMSVKNCYILTFNPDYVRCGDLNLNNLFKLNPADDELQSIETVEGEIKRLRAFLEVPVSDVFISKCKCGKFYECGYKKYCWENVPKYSVFDAFRGDLADELYSKYGADLKLLPPDAMTRQMHPGDIEAYLNNQEYIDKLGLREFVNGLQYPLYFLDYESIQPAVPMFDNSRPYQQICFQFSLHVQRSPNAPIEHYEYLHSDNETDPRPGLIQKLIECCGTTGSVIVYNQVFEYGRNTEMARDFPEYADGLNAINDRMVDLLIPFRTRLLYKPCQGGSASIKKTLPAFVPNMSYDDLGIHNGTQASNQFMDFMTGKQSIVESQKMMTDLHEYCGQDTMAMVELLNVIYGYINGGGGAGN